MKSKKTNKIKKLLKGLFRTQDEEVRSYFDPQMNSPDEYGLAVCLLKRYGQKPFNQGETEGILFECLRELCPDDQPDEMVEMKVKEFIDYGFVERWNNGEYW